MSLICKQIIEANVKKIPFNVQAAKVVQQIEDGVLSNLGINYFSYKKVYFNKDIPTKAFHLTNVTNYYQTMAPAEENVGFANVWYDMNKTLDVGDQINILWPINTKTVEQNFQTLGVTYPFNICYKKKGYIEAFGFSCNRLDIDVNNLYFNVTSTLEKFSAYFKEQASSLIRTAESNLAILPAVDFNLKSYDFSLYKPRMDIKLPHNLTPKELQCLKFLADGYAYGQIAGNLGISTRTVEDHMRNIRKKPRKVIAPN